jgi:hypothetical protein
VLHSLEPVWPDGTRAERRQLAWDNREIINELVGCYYENEVKMKEKYIV